MQRQRHAAPITSSLAPGGTAAVVVADFDGDGLLDVAGASQSAAMRDEVLAVAFGYGDGEFGPPILRYGMFSLQYHGVGGLDALDADGDGDLDLVAGAYGADDVELFLNDGAGTFTVSHRYGVAGRVTDVHAADFDGDGAVDVFANVDFGPPIASAVALLRNRANRLAVDDVGGGTNGSAGEPRLGATGSGHVGTPFTFQLRRARRGAPLALAIGASAVRMPFFGGTLVPAPDIVLPATTSASGTLSLTLSWPPAPRGYALFAQAWVFDLAAPHRLAASNAIEVRQN